MTGGVGLKSSNTSNCLVNIDARTRDTVLPPSRQDRREPQPNMNLCIGSFGGDYCVD